MRKIVLATGLLFLLQTAFNLSNVFAAYSLDDYYPTGQGSSWDYTVTRSNADGSGAWTDLERADINGFETVRYPDGAEYTGYKSWWWNAINHYVGYDVERLSANGLEGIKDVGLDSPGYSLYGRVDSAEPNQPYMGLPRTFDIGTEGDIAYKTYSYTDAGVLEGVTLNTEHYNVLGFEDVTVPAGSFNALKLAYLNTENGINTNAITSYLAKGVGEIKWEELGNHPGAPQTLQVGQLTSYTVTPEPISCALFLLGGGAMLAGKRFKRKAGILIS